MKIVKRSVRESLEVLLTSSSSSHGLAMLLCVLCMLVVMCVLCVMCVRGLVRRPASNLRALDLGVSCVS
jgi:hypothetical protein